MSRRRKAQGGYVARGWRWRHEDDGFQLHPTMARKLEEAVLGVDLARPGSERTAAVFKRKVRLPGRGIARWVVDEVRIAEVQEQIARHFKTRLELALIYGHDYGKESSDVSGEGVQEV